MYQYLLCWRYLRTRYIALASVISVMLGVATMIVVNSVMEGFTSEMRNRIHGILSDVTVESRSLSGMPDAQYHMDQIRKIAGNDIEAMTPTVSVPAMLSYQLHVSGQTINVPVQLIGIEASTQGAVSDFCQYLQHPDNRKQMTFDLHVDGYDTHDHQANSNSPEREQMGAAGWKWRRRAAREKEFRDQFRPQQPAAPQTQQAPPLQQPSYGQQQSQQENVAWVQPQAYLADAAPSSNGASSNGATAIPSSVPPAATGATATVVSPPPTQPQQQAPTAAQAAPAQNAAPGLDPFAGTAEVEAFDPTKQQRDGLVLGIAIAYSRMLKDPEKPSEGVVDRFSLLPGDDVALTFPSAGTPPKPNYANFTIVDFYESKMNEYDANLAFVPIRKLQELRGMIDPTTNVGFVNQIQIKVKPGVDGKTVRDKLAAVLPSDTYFVATWEDRQGALLAAVKMETAILNILLFLIIAVAGFGILAIFYMIVVEKTRDIGILKSLGASSHGVMGIFLSYGLSLGIVGAGAGLAIGLLFVRYINEIADVLGWITGRPVFDPTIYYFYKIPATVVPSTVVCVIGGAIGIAILASVLPARRAAKLHPVEALRYE